MSSLAFAVELHVCHKNMKKHLRALHTALIITPFHTFQLLPPLCMCCRLLTSWTFEFIPKNESCEC